MTPRLNKDGITLHSKEEFEGMRLAGRLAAEILDMIAPHVVPGARLNDLDQLCHDFMIANHSVPATLGYKGYPKSSCISVKSSLFTFLKILSLAFCVLGISKAEATDSHL